MSLFGSRFFDNEFAPMFRLLDDYANHVSRSSRLPTSIGSGLRSFQPRFDVTETKEAYELHGELPGIEQKNVSIEFTDAQTLTIKGRTEHSREEGELPTSSIESSAEQAKLTESGEASNNKYQQPSVEDEATTSGDKPEASSGDNQVATQQQQVETPKVETQKAKYWVSERSVGEFARTFSFPQRVDQDIVKASLKNGILSIVVPKAQAPQSRTINIE